MPSSTSKLLITAVPGFFQQAEPETDASLFDYAKNNFGLVDRVYETDQDFDPDHNHTQWQRFAHYVNSLRNQSMTTGADYRVLYLGRHGQGWHNVAEEYYGKKEWDRYWSKLDGGSIGDDQVIWSDAHLTEKGVQDALAVNTFWKHALSIAKVPAPQIYYTSPLHRCCETAKWSFSGLDLPENQPFIPEIRELLRETNGEHTCDRRSTRSLIASDFPEYTFEPGFVEDDVLWKADERETAEAQKMRLYQALEDIFIDGDGDAAFISITSHSGSIAAILAAVGHRPFALPTGGTMALFLKVEKMN